MGGGRFLISKTPSIALQNLVEDSKIYLLSRRYLLSVSNVQDFLKVSSDISICLRAPRSGGTSSVSGGTYAEVSGGLPCLFVTIARLLLISHPHGWHHDLPPSPPICYDLIVDQIARDSTMFTPPTASYCCPFGKYKHMFVRPPDAPPLSCIPLFPSGDLHLRQRQTMEVEPGAVSSSGNYKPLEYRTPLSKMFFAGSRVLGRSLVGVEISLSGGGIFARGFGSIS